MKLTPTKGSDRCPICAKYITPVKGAVCYHMPCLMKHTAPLRENMSKPTTIQLTFDSPELAEEWRGWYLDGGGEDAFSDTLSCRDFLTHPDFCGIRNTPDGITHKVMR